MRKILLTGKNGQVGWELQRTLATLGQVIALDRDDLDLADGDAIRRKVREIQPQMIVNPAAHTAVDKAEIEPELAMALNGIAPGIFAEEAKSLNALLVHYSTDYVFDGSQRTPYIEEDVPCPLSVYGATKLAGEQAIRAAGCRHLILRTSWVYGARGKNFLLTMRRLGSEREELRVVDDQLGAPTSSRAIAEVTSQILAQLYAPNVVRDWMDKVQGTYHLTNQGETTWCGFVREAIAGGLLAERVQPLLVTPINTAAYPTPAARPMYSVMSNHKLASHFGISMPPWQESLSLVLAELAAH